MYSHYVVVLDWATEYDGDVQILGVAHTLADAKRIFNEQIVEEKMIANDSSYYIEEDNGVMFNAGVMGSWRDNHITLYIQGVN